MNEDDFVAIRPHLRSCAEERENPGSLLAIT
jgi:hypothetical protein